MGKGINTKSTILDTALEIVSQIGTRGLTFGELAKAVGMSKSGLYAHFRGKDNLQLEVFKRAEQRFVEMVLKPAFAEPKGEARLRALIEKWAQFINQETQLPGGSVFVTASFELDDQPGPLRDFVQDVQIKLLGHLRKASDMAIETGEFRSDLDTERFAWSIFSLIIGYYHFKKMVSFGKADEFLKKTYNELLAYAGSQQNKKYEELKLTANNRVN